MTPDTEVAGLRRANAELQQRLDDALAQQAATAEVLQVINSSPGDLARVFDTILEKAHRLCGAEYGAFLTYDGERFRPAAAHGALPTFSELAQGGFRPGLGFNRLVRGERVLHIHDMAEAVAQTPGDPIPRALFDSGIRTQLAVPLRKDGSLLGIITANRREVRPFSDQQIALLEDFAAQAVIAMENARLITETREALERQTATAEVLQVINNSPGELAPVFDAMLDKALELCGAAFGVLWTYDGERAHVVALRGVPPAYAEFLTRMPHPVGPENALGRLLGGDPVVHIADAVADQAYQSGDPTRRALVELGGGRTLLAVPLRKDNTFLGHFVIYRREVRLFSDKQIALLQNFAAQAVIAMENARLLTETREALEQQTATAEVLQVINASPGNLAPVFDALLEKAIRLCESAFGILSTYDGECIHTAASRGTTPALADFLREPIRTLPGMALYRLVNGEDTVHVADITDEETYRSGTPGPKALADLGGVRTILLVALRKDGALLGAINIFRQEVRPFSDKQIALLQNFAAQAVIAMENARLIAEQREALEQQTATAEVLGVINTSPGNLTPVYDAMLEKAMHLCGAVFGSLTAWDGQYANVLAMRGFPPALAQYMAARGPRMAVSPAIVQLAETKRPQQIADVMAGESYRNGHPTSRAVADLGGARTILHVPLRKDEAMLGYISVYR
ncbi:MAG TPA: GAF domain-containing protein, partial [Acetobacteraceae bacterium]|nr:GAF domain-containing protein [Acetobacteraceae bacterium]